MTSLRKFLSFMRLLFNRAVCYSLLFFRRQCKGVTRPEQVVAIVLSWKRPWNLPYVVEGLKKQSFIDDIIIYHNYPSRLWIPGCKNIFSDKNLGCIVRHQLAANLKGYDYFVFSDDDLALSDDLAVDVLPMMKQYGRESVLGFFGRNFDTTDLEKAYTKGSYICSRQNASPVDMVLGRFHIISKEGIDELALSELNTPALISEDDIRANMSIQMKFKKPSFTIPTRNKLIELQDAHALKGRPAHRHLRNQAVLDAINFGWIISRTISHK